MAVREGEEITLLGAGRVVISEELDVWLPPRLCLWARVGGCGPLLNGTQDTHTFTAPRSGALELGLSQGEWGTEDGELREGAAMALLASGEIEVVVIRWKTSAAAGLAALTEALPDSALIGAERDRLGETVAVPEGWSYLWFLGPADIFTAAEHDGRRSIRARTAGDVGILQTPVDLPFGAGTRLSWRWCMRDIPSPVAEDTLPTHDYVSLAVEFDDGQDLTYYWSGALEPETHYRCPLPYWDQRETHIVVRSGAEGLGSWHRETRDLHADYLRAVGEPPGRIVAVWLIGVSLFQRRSGDVEFADIVLESNGATWRGP